MFAHHILLSHRSSQFHLSQSLSASLFVFTQTFHSLTFFTQFLSLLQSFYSFDDFKNSRTNFIVRIFESVETRNITLDLYCVYLKRNNKKLQKVLLKIITQLVRMHSRRRVETITMQNFLLKFHI